MNRLRSRLLRLRLLPVAAVVAAGLLTTAGASPAPSTPHTSDPDQHVAAPDRAETAKPGPFYWIVAEHSGKALWVENDRKDTGAPIVQYSKQNWGAQHWKVLRVEDDGAQSVRKFQNRHSKGCIVVRTTQQGETLTQSDCNTSWTDPRTAEWRVSNKWDMWAGDPFRVWSEYSGRCMDIAGGWTDDWIPATHYTCHGGLNQTFRLQHVPGT